jgi:fucokinase
VTSGLKIIRSEPGMIPDVTVHYVPDEVFDPVANRGKTLLYYTGITRLAKDVLQQIVGRYLDRNRATLATLRQIHSMPPLVADALSRKDLAAFGKLIAQVWRQNKQLDPNSSNEEVEELFRRIDPHVYGAKLAGAGGGGFLAMVCKSQEDAARVKEMLESEPPNERARFFDFNVSKTGLAISVC